MALAFRISWVAPCMTIAGWACSAAQSSNGYETAGAGGGSGGVAGARAGSGGQATGAIAGSRGGAAGSAVGGRGGAGGATGGSSAGGSSAGGATGTGGFATGGIGGALPGLCPLSAPIASGACDLPVGVSCSYQDCDGPGLVIAVCLAGQWQVMVSACGTFVCGYTGETCSAGQLCVEHQSGAAFAGCESNQCGTGPISCDCVCPGDNCTVVSATEVTCRSSCTLCP